MSSHDFDRLLAKYRNAIIASVTRKPGVTREDAEDAYQRACARAWKKGSENFRDGEALRNYLKSSASGYATNDTRTDAGRRATRAELPSMPAAERVDAIINRRLDIEKACEALQLPTRLRGVVTEVMLEGTPIAVASEWDNALRVRAQRAVDRVRRMLDEHTGYPPTHDSTPPATSRTVSPLRVEASHASPAETPHTELALVRVR